MTSIPIYLAYRANAKNVIYQTIKSVLKARGKRALADVNCYCKIMLVVACNVVFIFKDATCKRLRHIPIIVGFLQCNGGK